MSEKERKEFSAFNRLLHVGEMGIGGRSGQGFRVDPHFGLRDSNMVRV